MKTKLLLTAGLLGATLIYSSASAAEEQSYLNAVSDKLSQGLANLGTGFIELPKNIVNISAEQNVFVGITLGTIRGTVHGVTRTLIGGAEFLTAAIPSNAFISPGYVWERFSEDSRYFGLHYPGYWTHYGPLDDGK